MEQQHTTVQLTLTTTLLVAAVAAMGTGFRVVKRTLTGAQYNALPGTRSPATLISNLIYTVYSIIPDGLETPTVYTHIPDDF